ncbi:hypothetical protein [Candidatus Tisiphia endosymbiont of Thecophora atra]|uniref:hypothetical protein n=1 Tax=Candidatus Tisiphia endosymbiont of Thecophora atra TaxID=3066258 RepID=UPI00312CA11E
MSLPESEEALSAIKQLREKMKTEQGIFEEANKDLKVLQRDIREKQTALDTLRENLQEQDKDASELLGKLWKQQEKIKGHLAAQSADEIKKAVQEQNEFIDSELELIKQQYENIVLNLELCREFEQFLHGDGKDTSHRSIEHKEAFAQFLAGNELLSEDNKEQLLEKNSQLMVELNASMQNLEKRDKNLIELKKELQKKDLPDNLTAYVQPKLQELFKARQAEITKEIDVILAENPIIVEQYENVKLREEEIKTIQDEIDAKTKIIEQSKQKEEQLFEELKQLEQKSYPPLSSAKQQQGSVSQYSILQERANDAEASVKRQIEINKLNEQLKIAQGKIDDQDHQLQQLKSLIDTEKLSAEQESKKNLERISEFQERIRELEGEKEEQQQSTISHGRSWADELQELGESDGSLSDQIDKLTSENDKLRAKLEATEKNAKEQLEVLSEEKDLEYKAKENYAAKLQEINKELSKLKSEQQEKQAELDRTKEELTGTSKKLLEAEELHGQESKQAKKLQDQVEELTKVQHQLTTNLDATEKDVKNQIKALTEVKEAANLDLQAAEVKYAAMLKGQSEAAAVELQTINEKLSQLKSEQQEKQAELERTKEELTGTSEKLVKAEELHGQESKQAKELQDQLDGLTKAQRQLTTELEKTREEKERQIKALTEAKEAANLDLQAAEEKYAAMLKGQSEVAAAELQTLNEQLSQLKSEQQAKQAELQKTKAELTNTREELVKVEELHGKESKQAEELQDQLDELTKVQHKLTTELKEIREEKESQIKALTEAKEAANLDLQAAEEKYAAMLKGQSEVAVAELRTLNEELSQLKLEQQKSWSELEKKQQELIIVQESLKAAEQEYGVESKQAKELQAQLGGLTNENNSLKTQLEEIENERKQLEVLSGKKDLEYNYLEAEYEKQQAELKKIQQELTEAQEELTLEKAISDEQYDQNKNFKTQLNKVTDENAGLKSQLEKIKEDTKNQLETLSARKDLEYNALKEEQKRSMDELYGRLKDAEKHNQIMQGVEQAGIKDIQDKNAKIAALERQNAALLEQLEKLQIKAEVQGASVQTDKIVSQSIGTETEIITKEFRAVDSQTDNRQKLYQSVGTEYSPRMDSGMSVDKVLVQDKTKGSVYDDDKILQAFKELSREQVQPIVNKFSLESTSSFAQFAQKNVGGLSEVLRDSEVLREIENIEQRGYTDIHKKFAAEYKDIEWQDKGADKSFSLQQNGKDVVTINETILSHDDKNAKYKTSEGEEIKNARMVNIPLSIDMQGACHMSFAVQDTNGRNISKEDAVYLTAHYKNGKLVHLTKPTEIFSCSEDNKSPLYLKRKGKTYTLPVDKSTLEKLEQEVLKNKGEYVGIVKNARGNIRVNSAAVPGLQPDRVTADPLFKDASQLLHDANATPALDGSLDKKGLANKQPNRNVGGGRDC